MASEKAWSALIPAHSWAALRGLALQLLNCLFLHELFKYQLLLKAQFQKTIYDASHTPSVLLFSGGAEKTVYVSELIEIQQSHGVLGHSLGCSSNEGSYM